MTRLINSLCMETFPWPNSDANKHSRGRLAVFSGGNLQTGAARLAANCGARIGAGWVKIFAPNRAAQIIATHISAIMVDAYEHGDDLPPEIHGYNALVIGPAFGFGAAQQTTLTSIMGLDKCLVLDADALTMLSLDSKTAFEIIKARKAPTILTPHSGEFSRLFGLKVSKQIEVRIEETVYGAKKSGAIIVHKGAQTIIATPNEEVWLLDNATPWLASAGTGDCLAGLIGGLAAQSCAPIDACKMAVFLHAQIGAFIGAGLIADDIAPNIGAVLDIYAPDNLKRR
ncbi:MAG: sugar kinase [Hyphomonadaceae bacterium]|nr:MAG: sugar kinase [Hyphomonadaceae bacterium]KAF0186046.1 MAG: sugar kinase [Hyphomonadaceae bacterium]